MFETKWCHYWFLDVGCILCQRLFFAFFFLAFWFLGLFWKFCRTTGIDISECEEKVSDQLSKYTIIGKVPERFFYKMLWSLVNWALGVVELLGDPS